MIDPRLAALAALFAKWNRSINLSAASTAEEIDAHIDDSSHVIEYLRGRSRILDVGSGGGFPVVVAAIALPDSRFVALEPIHKKHAFLKTAARELKLANLDPRAERLEDHATHDYDAAMSRATFDLVEWLERGKRYVAPSGIVLGFEAIRRDDLPASIERHPYTLDGKPRAIVIARQDVARGV